MKPSITSSVVFVVFSLMSSQASYLRAQTRFSGGADSLEWLEKRRFELFSLSPHLTKELRSKSVGPVQELKSTPEDGRQPVDITGGDANPDGVSTRLKSIRTGDETVFEPMVAVSPADDYNFVTVYSGIQANVYRSKASYSTNGGVSWMASDIPTSWMLYNTQGDGSIAFDADGKVYHCYIDFNLSGFLVRQNAIVVGQSQDKGVTWTNQLTVVNETNFNTTTNHDKPWITCDQSNGSYRNSVYVSWTRFTNSVSNSQIVCSYKRSNGQNFSSPPIVVSAQIGFPDVVQGSFPVVGSDGIVYIFWLKYNSTTTSASLWMNKSVDGGVTFNSVPTELTALGAVTRVGTASTPVLGGLFQKANSIPAAAIRKVGSPNEICLAWCDYRNGKPEILFSKTVNGGISWTSVARVYQGAGVLEQFLPAMSTNAQGDIYISYLDRLSSTNNNIGLNVAESHDGGVFFNVSTDGRSFLGVADISHPPDPPNYLFTGDYMGIASNGYTYWAVFPAVVGDHITIEYNNDIFGSYRSVWAWIRNNLPLDPATFVAYDGIVHYSPYQTDWEVAGKISTIGARQYGPSF